MEIVDKLLNKYNVNYTWVVTNVVDETCESAFLFKEEYIKYKHLFDNIIKYKFEE